MRTAALSETAVIAGDSVTATVVLATDGNRRVNHSVVLRVDGEPVRNATVSVPADGNRTVTLTHGFDAPGDYALTVGNESVGSVTVDQRPMPTETATATLADTDAPTETLTTSPPAETPTGGSGLCFGVVGVLVAALAAVLLARWRG